MTEPGGIQQLGHTGLYVHDLEVMRDFYRDVLGLTVTDEDHRVGFVFLSSRPEVEHHELVLAKGRIGGPDVQVVNQISWRLNRLEDVQRFHLRFLELGVRIRQVVTHGNAIGIYFFDPEGNVNEVYWMTGDPVPQPFRESIDLDQSPEQVMVESRRLAALGPQAYGQPDGGGGSS